jgi:hypothetical protein
MRSVAPLGLRHAVQVSNHHFVGSPPAHGLGMISHGSFIHHITMAEQAITNLAPTVLEIVVDHLAPHASGLVGDLPHHTAR